MDGSHLFPRTNKRPRVPLMDNLYWILQDYRCAKSIGLRAVAIHRRRALEIIAEIKRGEHA